MLFTNQDIAVLHGTRRKFINRLKNILKTCPYDHYTSRIKSDNSIRSKLRRKGFDDTIENAITELSDIIGIRIVCQYLTDVYDVVHTLHDNFDIKLEHDYISNPKPSGYRSYHIIISVPLGQTGQFLHKDDTIDIEIQVRTMGMDFWASLEHSLIYDKIKNAETAASVNKNETLIRAELVHYADDIFSIDMRLQALQKLTEN